MADAREILRRVPIFADLSDEDCDVVLRVLKARRGRPGDTLVREGEPGDTLMIVVEGQLEASVTTSGGAQARLSIIPAGHIVGELAFLDASPRAATVTTPTGATVLEFSRQALLLLCRDRPKIAASIQRNVLADLSQRVRAVEGTQGRAPAASAAPASLRSVSLPRESVVPVSARPKGRPVTAAALRAIPILATHSNEDLELLAYAATLRGFAKGEVLMHEGAVGDAAYLIVNGSVSVTRRGSPGIVATLETGALVGQLALLDRAPRSATVTAGSDTTTLELRADVVQNLLRASSPLALRFQREIAGAAARHLRAATARFAASAGPAAEAGPLDAEIEGDWSRGEEEPIELAVDMDAIRR
jgi:CRP-like cAMP-binding protein